MPSKWVLSTVIIIKQSIINKRARAFGAIIRLNGFSLKRRLDLIKGRSFIKIRFKARLA
jgi:hypothetical protein